jgi:AAA+ superfamily predicted ATPase
VDDALIDSLRRATDAAPGDVPLRVHLGRLLLDAGRTDEAMAEAVTLMSIAPDDPDARALMLAALGSGPVPQTPPTARPGGTADVRPAATRPETPAPAPTPDDSPASSAPRPDAGPERPVDATPRLPADADHGPTAADEHDEHDRHDGHDGFDWSAAEQEIGDVVRAPFTAPHEDDPASIPDPLFDTERAGVTFADVGGMQGVKDRLNAAFLAPLANPELRRMYGKSLRGGLLMYGPPGCGKTYIARAIAGELGARFLSIGLTDILDPMLGVSEQNVREAFQQARRDAPCVVFLDEIDAIGQRRAQTRNTAMRGTVNQLLTELDGIEGLNEGVFVLAATNQPWDIDPALRRPGRLDRTVLVLPPDEAAREAVFRHHLRQRPIEGIDTGVLAKRSDLLSGADIAYVCELAAERALLDSVRTGSARMIGMADVLGALGEVKPSTSGWLESARNVVTFGDDDGTYTELKAYLKKTKRL